MERGVGGVFCSVELDEIFWFAKISQKMSNSQTCWAWGRGAPNRTREGRISQRGAPEKSLGPCLIHLFIFFLFEWRWSASDLWYSWSWVVWAQLKSVELVKTQAIRTRNRRWRGFVGFWPTVFCFNQWDVHIRSILGLGRDCSRDIIPLSLPTMLSLLWSTMSLSVQHFFCAKLILCSNVRAKSLWTLCKKAFIDISSCALSCHFMIRECSAGPCMISSFEHKSLLLPAGSVYLCFSKACHIQWFTKKMHALKVCIPAHLDHSHVQNRSWTVVHSYWLSEFASMLALSCFTCIILHALSVVPVCICVYWNYSSVSSWCFFSFPPRFCTWRHVQLFHSPRKNWKKGHFPQWRECEIVAGRKKTSRASRGTTHVHAHIEVRVLHVYAGIPTLDASDSFQSWACICICWLYRGVSVYHNLLACIRLRVCL